LNIELKFAIIMGIRLFSLNPLNRATLFNVALSCCREYLDLTDFGRVSWT